MHTKCHVTKVESARRDGWPDVQKMAMGHIGVNSLLPNKIVCTFLVSSTQTPTHGKEGQGARLRVSCVLLWVKILNNAR